MDEASEEWTPHFDGRLMIRLGPGKPRAFWGARELRAYPSVIAVLAALAAASSSRRALSVDALARSCEIAESTVCFAIHRLRGALAAVCEGELEIVTARGWGYRLQDPTSDDVPASDVDPPQRLDASGSDCRSVGDRLLLAALERWWKPRRRRVAVAAGPSVEQWLMGQGATTVPLTAPSVDALVASVVDDQPRRIAEVLGRTRFAPGAIAIVAVSVRHFPAVSRWMAWRWPLSRRHVAATAAVAVALVATRPTNASR